LLEIPDGGMPEQERKCAKSRRKIAGLHRDPGGYEIEVKFSSQPKNFSEKFHGQGQAGTAIIKPSCHGLIVTSEAKQQQSESDWILKEPFHTGRKRDYQDRLARTEGEIFTQLCLEEG
jgi:hypothetical protein